MNRDFSLKPEVMVVLPDGNLLLNKLIPKLVKLEEVLISDR